MHIQRTTTVAGRAAAYAGAVALVVLGAACGSALDVPNPQAFGDDALNNPIILKNVANGAEGSLHQAFDDYIVMTELLSDEVESTSTWIDWEDVSEGRVRNDWTSAGAFSDPQDQLLRARFAAQSAAERVEKVLGADATTSPLRAQVHIGWRSEDFQEILHPLHRIAAMFYIKPHFIGQVPRGLQRARSRI